MGDVRVSVRLTNYFDLLMADRAGLPRGDVRFFEGEAVVDTGAVRCVVPPHVADLLGVRGDRRRVAAYADGRSEEVGVTDALLMRISDREEIEDAFILGDEILIGQTLLEKTDLLVDCTNRRVMPNPAHPNQPVNKIR